MTLFTYINLEPKCIDTLISHRYYAVGVFVLSCFDCLIVWWFLFSHFSGPWDSHWMNSIFIWMIHGGGYYGVAFSYHSGFCSLQFLRQLASSPLLKTNNDVTWVWNHCILRLIFMVLMKFQGSITHSLLILCHLTYQWLHSSQVHRLCNEPSLHSSSVDSSSNSII